MKQLELEKIDYPAVGECLYRAVLENGLRVFLLPKLDFNETYGIMTAQFGSVDTQFIPRGGVNYQSYPAGIAHFLEHKLFENEEGQDMLQEFVALGAESNAFTSFSRTSYLFSGTEKIRESLDLLQELVGEAYFTEESVEREQGIIQQEIEMYQDDPDYRLFFEALANLYPHTPLAEDIAGDRDSIAEISPEDLYENFDTFYHPSNMSLFVIGNFDLEQIFKDICSYQETYQDLDTGQEVQQIERAPLPLHPVIPTGNRRMEVASPKLAVGLRGRASLQSQEIFRYKLLLKILFAMLFGWTSKRFQSLYEAGKMDTSLSLEVEVEEAYHFVMLTMDTQEPVTLSNQIRSAIKNFEKDRDVNEDHLDTVKSEMYGDFLHGLNSLQYMATQYEPHLDGENLFDLPKILQDIHLDDVLEAGHRFVDNCDMTDFIIFPK